MLYQWYVAIVTDIPKNLSNQETDLCSDRSNPCCRCSFLTMDSAIVPMFFLLSIGMAIVYNLGSNVFMGEISYVTQALAAVLQLGVTMDYSIFLWHSYGNSRSAMRAIRNVRWHMPFQYDHLCCGKFHYNGGRVYRTMLYELCPWYGPWCCYGKRCCNKCRFPL